MTSDLDNLLFPNGEEQKERHGLRVAEEKSGESSEKMFPR